jgi:homogentisate 1,2-dioxygenase
MGRQFSVQRGATRVVFGSGASDRLASELETLGIKKALIACTPGRRDAASALSDRLGARSAGVLALAREHVPRETVTEAEKVLATSGADAVVAFGGGSTIGLAKALALGGKVRVVAMPTTYSGSEITSIYGITEGGKKTTGKDERVRASLVVYDPKLTYALPREVTITSAWNAIAHAAEALWSSSLDRAAALAAEEALRLLASAVRRLAFRLDDVDARDDALEGAYLAGAAFADAGSGLHHKLCHLMGGMFAMPHAATHAVLLPHVARFQRASSPDAMKAIARALGVLDPIGGLTELARATGAPQSLRALGMPEGGVERVADAAIAALPSLDRGALASMLTSAFTGPTAGATTKTPLRAPATLAGLPGLGSTHESEAIQGAIPRTQNAPRRSPYGLYPELLNGTPFTVKSAENSRVWMYRVRPSFSHGPLTPLPAGLFGAELGGVNPNRTRWRPQPMPSAPAEVDFLDGLVTLGGAGDPSSGPGFAVNLYAANVDMSDRAFANTDGDVLIVPQTGTIECRTELGWLRAAPGTVILIPRAIKFAIGLPDGPSRGWMLEVFGRRLRLPERGPIGSNGMADARHFMAPAASFEDRTCPGGFQIVNKSGGRLYAATQQHSPFDVVGWHGNHAPHSYDLSLFNAMGSVTWDHPDPSILTVLTAPLDDHGRAIVDFVVFPGRWEVIEHSFRPPFMHRNAASEVNMVVRTPAPEHGYDPGCTFVSPLLTAHGVVTTTYEAIAKIPDDVPDPPRRIPDESVWAMFESAFPFRATAWAESTPLVDDRFLALFEGLGSFFDPKRK